MTCPKNAEAFLKTECGKDVHLIGTGVCGQEVYQVRENNASIKDHEGWRLCRLENNELISFGKSGIKYKLKTLDNQTPLSDTLDQMQVNNVSSKDKIGETFTNKENSK